MPFYDKDWEDLQRDCTIFPAYTDYIFGPDTRTETANEPGLHPMIYPTIAPPSIRYTNSMPLRSWSGGSSNRILHPYSTLPHDENIGVAAHKGESSSCSTTSLDMGKLSMHGHIQSMRRVSSTEMTSRMKLNATEKLCFVPVQTSAGSMDRSSDLSDLSLLRIVEPSAFPASNDSRSHLGSSQDPHSSLIDKHTSLPDLRAPVMQAHMAPYIEEQLPTPFLFPYLTTVPPDPLQSSSQNQHKYGHWDVSTWPEPYHTSVGQYHTGTWSHEPQFSVQIPSALEFQTAMPYNTTRNSSSSGNWFSQSQNASAQLQTLPPLSIQLQEPVSHSYDVQKRFSGNAQKYFSDSGTIKYPALVMESVEANWSPYSYSVLEDGHDALNEAIR